MRHAAKLREDLSDELPNGVGNTIDALLARLRQQAAEIATMRAAASHLADEMDGLLPYLASHNWRLDRLYKAVSDVRATLQDKKETGA